MARLEPQNFANHARYVPLYHFVLSLLLLVNLACAGWRLFRDGSLDAVVALLTALALVLLFYYARAFALRVQDRLIRLEERLRLAAVLPGEVRGRIDELTPDQLIGLRFAADDELAELVPRVLDGSLVGRSAIKKSIRSWRPDHFRC